MNNSIGTINLSTINWASGKYGSALACPTTASTTTGITFTPTLATGSTFTWEAYLRTDASVDSYACIYTQAGADGVYLSSIGGLNLYIGGNNLSAAGLVDGVWTHCAIVCNELSVSFYFDGVKDANTPTVSSGFTAGTIFNDGASETFDGAIEYMRVWNRALSQNEIRRLFINPYEMFALN